jgi:hypothetical protein
MSACVSVTVGLAFEPKSSCGEQEHEEECERRSYSRECD